MRVSISVAVAIALMAACAEPPSGQTADVESELAGLYEARDYFRVRIPGIIGFPVLEAMGEVLFHRNDTLEVPASPPIREIHNLALELLEPLVLVHYGSDSFVCRFDTGANKTAFYEPFYRRYRSELETRAEKLTTKTAGVGGAQEIQAYRLPQMELTLGGASVQLTDDDVYTEIIAEDDNNYLYCNIGQDALEPFDAYIMNFRSMSLLLK